MIFETQGKSRLQLKFGIAGYLVDDILDMGKTICATAAELEKSKPKSVHALIPHGLFGEGAAQALDKSCIEKIYVTNSVNRSILKSPKISILKTDSIISNFLKITEKIN